MTGSWTDHPRIQTLRRRSSLADVAVRTLLGFRDHRSGRNAALIAHYGFLSLFPLMLVFTTILGFVLQARDDLQADIIDSAMAQLPFLGETIASHPERLRGSVFVLIVGLVTALWSAMKAFVAVQGSLDDVHEIPLPERTSFVHTRTRALEAIVVVGTTQVVTAFITSVVGVVDLVWVGKVLLVLVAVAINALILALTYRWLCSTTSTWRAVAPGALFGGFAFALLQLLGTTIVARAIANASPVYGSFASVIALLLWLGLHATVTLVGAELNRVVTLRNPIGC